MLAAVISAGVLLWTVLLPSPEKVIRKQLAELARVASFSGNQGSLAVISGAQKLAGFFSTNVEVNLNLPGHAQILNGRDEVMQAAAGARTLLDGLQVKFPDVNVTVAPDKQSANADLTVEARAAGDRGVIWQEMKFTFQKTGGKWLISRVETVRTLT